MLVLTRKQNESIEIPSLGISIEVLEVKRNRVRLGVVGPREVCVMRSELLNCPKPFKASGRSTEGAQEKAHQHT